MDQTSKEIISVAVTYILLAVLGVRQSSRVKLPLTTTSWILLVVGALLLGYVFPGVTLISVFGFDVHFNWTLQGFVIGLLVGLIAREIRRRRQLAS